MQRVLLTFLFAFAALPMPASADAQQPPLAVPRHPGAAPRCGYRPRSYERYHANNPASDQPKPSGEPVDHLKHGADRERGERERRHWRDRHQFARHHADRYRTKHRDVAGYHADDDRDRPLARRDPPYSHSIVPGGLLVMSRTTRPTGRISLIIREAICSRRSYGKRAQSAVIASSLVTARITITLP